MANQFLGRYGFAIATVLAALLLMLGLDPVLHLTQASFLLFFGAVTVSALYGGRSPGIAATLLSALLANYFFLPPQYQWTLDLPAVARMLLFILQGILISHLLGALRHAQETTRRNLKQLKAAETEVNTLNQALQQQIDELQRLVDIERQRNSAIAELQQSEERYRYLAESIPQLIWTASPEGVLLDLNQRWLDFTGLTLAQAQSEGWAAVVHPDDVSTLGERWLAAQQEQTHYQAEGRMRRVDGVYCWHLHQAIPLKNEQGQIIKWFGTATDIDDKKRLEQQRDQLLEREQAARAVAEQANRVKDEFLAVLSHELRTPLNPILGWSKLLRGGTLDPAKTEQALETIERNARLQTQLIEDLLDVSRILQGKLSLSMATVDVALTIEAALETVRLAAEAKSIQVHVALDPNVGPVLGDAARLQQVVWNLLSNAIKFTPVGGQIEVRLDRANSQAQIRVKDTGKGIPPDFLPYVFDYFRQADSTTTRQFGGLGLGLAIVHQLVELHGGTIQVTSPGPGQGTTFTFTLPLLAKESQQSNREADFPQPTSVSSPLRGIRVLLVDDDIDSRELLAFILAEAGAMPTDAASAPEALKLFPAIKPDIVISDIGMPGMDGYRLIQQIREMPPEQGSQVPAIALTAYAAEIDRQQALAAGFQCHIAKPVEPDELIQAALSLLEQSAYQKV